MFKTIIIKIMGSFNPINLIVNTIGIIATNKAQNNMQGQNTNNLVQNSNTNQITNQTNINNTQQSSFKPLNYNNLAQNQTGFNSLSNVNQLMISTVEVEQRANYIKDLLNLPRDFQTMINMIEGNLNPNTKAFQDLSKLLVNGKINLTALTSLLGENSKEAVQKLMMTIMTVSKMGSNDVGQLKELMALFSGANASIESAQTVKNLIMLYLPWLPLSVRSDMNLDFDIDIFEKIQGPDPNEEESGETIKIMIETANYGNIMATLELTQNQEVDVLIIANSDFPEDKVLEEFKKENKKDNLRTNVSIEKTENEIDLKTKQNVQITSTNYVSPKLVLSAHSLIKIIIDVDNDKFIINEDNE